MDEAFGFGGQCIWKPKLTALDLLKEGALVNVIKRIMSH